MFNREAGEDEEKVRIATEEDGTTDLAVHVVPNAVRGGRGRGGCRIQRKHWNQS